MMHSRILGVGSYVPPGIVKNDDLKQWMETSDEWIQQRTGIQQRHWVEINSEIGNSDLAVQAVERALAAARVKKDEIEMIIYATLSPDVEFPGTACFLQAKLGLPGIAALDIRQQCTGFIYGLSIPVIMYFSSKKVSLKKFIINDFFVVVIYMFFIVSIGYFAGEGFNLLSEIFRSLRIALLFLLLLIVCIYLLRKWMSIRLLNRKK